MTIEDEVLAALRRITRSIDLHSRLLLQQRGLTVPQLAALRAIQELQPVSAGGLAKAIHVSQATVTGVLSRLESKGLVTRTRSGSDRRSVFLELTTEGARLVDEVPSPLHDRFRAELDELQQWEQTLVLATLQRVAAMMEAGRIEGPTVLSPDEGVAGEEEYYE